MIDRVQHSEKLEWRKQEKAIYLPANKPAEINLPEFGFITIRGAGSPAEGEFTEKVGALYALAYAIKMTLKKMPYPPEGYSDFSVYPLEGVWDINAEAKKSFTGAIQKQDLVYQLMIRQPTFVNEGFFKEMQALAKAKKANPLFDEVSFERVAEGHCVQMLHLGRFEDEPTSFEKMEAFANERGLVRLSKVHREIYLSDARKVAPEKLKTVLRFQVETRQHD